VLKKFFLSSLFKIIIMFELAPKHGIIILVINNDESEEIQIEKTICNLVLV